MNIKDYISIRKKELESFQKYWEVESNKNKVSFPEELNDCEFFEQELFYLDHIK